MKKSIIAAMSSNHGLGKDNKMIWHLPEDLKKFKEYTVNHHILMGRKTFESIGNKALPNRVNIVISRNESYKVPNGVILVKSIEEGIEFAEKNNETELFIIGGGEIYDKTINIVDSIYLTRLLERFDCDTFFPAVDYSKFEVRDEIERVIFQNFTEKRHSYEHYVLDRIS